MDFISKQYEDMKDKLTKMESERKNHLAHIQSLEQKVENMERFQRQATIEIRNIPVNKKENKQDLIKLVERVGDLTGISVEESQIRDIFRLKTKKEDNQPVIVDFTSTFLKEKVLTSVKAYNKSKKEHKINTRDLKIDGEAKPVFITECLTQNAKRIYFLAREFSKKHNYAYCWTTNGKVFLRKKEGSPPRRIGTVTDLDLVLTLDK